MTIKRTTLIIKNYRIITVFVFIALFSIVHPARAQVKYSGKFEFGYLNYLSRTLIVEAGPGWKGYPLEKGQSGIEVSAINGITLKQRFFIGIGIGYLNYEGTPGYSIYGDIEFLTSKKSLSPLLGFKAGHSKINNQYENGSRSGSVELDLGLNYKPTGKFSVYLKSGVEFVYGASFVPIRIGLSL